MESRISQASPRWDGVSLVFLVCLIGRSLVLGFKLDPDRGDQEWAADPGDPTDGWGGGYTAVLKHPGQPLAAVDTKSAAEPKTD